MRLRVKATVQTKAKLKYYFNEEKVLSALRKLTGLSKIERRQDAKILGYDVVIYNSPEKDGAIELYISNTPAIPEIKYALKSLGIIAELYGRSTLAIEIKEYELSK